jgi:hypothetical protein
MKIMAKLKGKFVKTDGGIFDINEPSNNKFEIKVDSDKKATLVLVGSRASIGDVYEVYDSLEEMLKKDLDMVEIKEPGMRVRYAIFRGVVDEKVDTNEGLVDPIYITAYLDYNTWLDTYTRFKLM